MNPLVRLGALVLLGYLGGTLMGLVAFRALIRAEYVSITEPTAISALMIGPTVALLVLLWGFMRQRD